MKTVAIIQARMTSTRLPGKIMAEVTGYPLIYHVVNRAQQAETLDLVAIATSNGQADDVVAQFCLEVNISCFRGSEDDVLDRYYQAARYFEADTVVRLTADCPLLDPEVIDRVVQKFKSGQFDYVSNTLECTYPDGLDTEVFRHNVLKQAWGEARLKSEREHVTSYIYNHPEKFHLGQVKYTEDLSALRWTVDEPQDLEFVRLVYQHLGESSFGMAEVLNLLQTQPNLRGINAGVKRNEGYQKSLRQDSLIEKSEAK